MTSGRTCAFCGGQPVTLEHAWPNWMNKLRGQLGSPESAKRPMNVTFGKTPKRKSQVLDVQVKRFCQPCNGGWMSVLEQRAEPLISRMARAEKPLPLNGADRRLLATWAYKTALVMEFVLPRQREFSQIPQAVFEQFYRDRSPPILGAVIWAAAYSGPTHVVRGQRIGLTCDWLKSATREMSGQVGDFSLTTFTIHHAVFQVMAHIRGHVADIPEESQWSPYLIRLWPTINSGMDNWPARDSALTDDTLKGFCERREF